MNFNWGGESSGAESGPSRVTYKPLQFYLETDKAF